MSDKPQCQHILDSGHRCQTPPVKDQPFCYYHGRLHATFVLPGHPRYVPPMLDSPHSIHIALRHVYLALAKNLIDRKHAATLLYALQLAQSNAPQELAPDSDSVEEVTPAMQPPAAAQEDNTPRSTDTAPRVDPLLIGVNIKDPVLIAANNNPDKALQRSKELWSRTFSRYDVPESLPELDLGEWLKLTRDLPPPGQAGNAQQQVNCARVLQILHHHDINRRMAGLK